MNPIVDSIADAVNPILALVAIAVAIIEWRAGWRRGLAFTAATAAGLAGVYIVQALDARLSIWQRFGSDYSTHSAFATSVVVSMAFWRPRWRIALFVVLALYLILVVAVGYHHTLDVVTAVLVACGWTAPWHAGARRLVHE